jgi:hypothetical protein
MADDERPDRMQSFYSRRPARKHKEEAGTGLGPSHVRSQLQGDLHTLAIPEMSPCQMVLLEPYGSSPGYR